jgi:endonuclease-3 related protein
LLEQNGIGPETADSILLYAGQHPVFVVDAYTKRILSRHEVVAHEAKYDEIRDLVERALGTEVPVVTGDLGGNGARPVTHPPSAMSTAAREWVVQVYNEMHGLFVQVGKHYCDKRNPKCEECPLGTMLERPVKLQSGSRVGGQSFDGRRQQPRKTAKPRL